ncbi:MAG: protein kinase [Verrucomicrobiae bacterium]|nr:protein kinase [Verrucomicrobiae bacterium]
MSTPREVTLLARVLEIPEAERDAWLDRECTGDPALRERLRRRLAPPETSGRPDDPASDASTLPSETFLPDNELSGAATLQIGTEVGRYRLLEKLGEGGCGLVYVAEQTEPVRRRVALKVIKLGMDTRSVVARFEAERQALAMMDHPNIARVLDAGTTAQGRPFFVMELVRGIRITEYCDRNRLTTRHRIELFIQVCQAIQHAHQKGIIHRDIKPSNILVTTSDGPAAAGVPKVIDFGIAKATEGRLTDATVYTQLHQFIGTPAYMSPEQAEMSGLDMDTRSDIYSLGVLLYELLAGCTPFDSRELMASGLDAMRRTLREQEPLRPSNRLAALPGPRLTTTAQRHSTDASRLLHQVRGDLDWIVMKCLEKDRTRRYDSAGALAADLRRHLNNEPVIARPPSAAYRFRKSLRRHRLAFSAAAVVVLALVSGLGISLWLYAGKSAAEREQQTLRVQAEVAARDAGQAMEQAARQRDLARERLYESLLREAGSIRRMRRLGYRREVFDRLNQALTLGAVNADLGQLRREASASFGDWVGLDPVKMPIPGGVGAGALSGDGTLAALAEPEHRAVSLRESRTGHERARLAVGGHPVSLALDRRGLTLWVALVDVAPGTSVRPDTFRVEQWTVRADGSWILQQARTPAGRTQFVSSPDGPVAFLLSTNRTTLTLLDPERDVELAVLPLGNRMPWLPQAALGPDRRQVAFFSFEGDEAFDVQLELWDLETRRQVAVVVPKLGPGWGLSFAPDGQALAATFDHAVVVYDTRSFRPLLSLSGAFEQSLGAALGGVPTLLAVPSPQEMAVRLIQLETGREVALLNLNAIPNGESFSQDGSVLLLTHSNGGDIVSLKADGERIRLQGHQGGVPAVVFTPDGTQLASVGKDRTLRVWNLAKPGDHRQIGSLPGPGQALAFSPAGDVLVSSYYNTGELSFWSPATGTLIGRMPEDPEFRGTLWSIDLSPDGRHLAAIGPGLRVWDFPALLESARGRGDFGAPVLVETNGLAGSIFDPANRRVAFMQSATSQPEFTTRLQVRDLSQGSTRTVATDNQNYFVQGHTFLPRSGALAYVTRDREVAVVDPADGRRLRTFATRLPGDPARPSVANLAASPDESRLALVTPSGLGVNLWDPESGGFLYSLPEEHGTIWWLAWSPDGQRLAISRSNGDIAVWNLLEIEDQLSALGLMTGRDRAESVKPSLSPPDR